MNDKIFTYGPDAAKAAVSLTYDDALEGHWREVAPALESQGLRGTFFVVPRPQFIEQVEEWRQVANAGHELGNHTLFHPCRREPASRFEWLNESFDLCHYNETRWREEMRVANALLQLIDGRSRRTFGNTCCNTEIGSDGNKVQLAPIIEEMFVAGRGSHSNLMVSPAKAEFGELGHFSGDGKTFEELRALVEQAFDCGGWLILMFHGVGNAEHSLHIDPEEHAKFLHYLGNERQKVWTAPLVDVAETIQKHRRQLM